MNTPLWSFTMDAELHLTIFRNRAEVWSGSYEAFVADGDVIPPDAIAEQIHERYEMLATDDDTRSNGPRR